MTRNVTEKPKLFLANNLLSWSRYNFMTPICFAVLMFKLLRFCAFSFNHIITTYSLNTLQGLEVNYMDITTCYTGCIQRTQPRNNPINQFYQARITFTPRILKQLLIGFQSNKDTHNCIEQDWTVKSKMPCAHCLVATNLIQW